MNSFHEFRKQGIGGSDVAAILKCSKYATPLDIYHSKMPDYKYEEGDNPRQKWGKLLENTILDQYTEQTGVPLVRQVRIIDKEYPYLRGNIDGWSNNDQKVLVDAKNTVRWQEWGEEGGDDIPLEYLCQIAHYARIINAEKVDIAVLLQGYDFRIYHYERHATLEKELKERCLKFWKDHVLKCIPPPPISGNDVQNHIKCIAGKTIIATKEIKSLVSKLRDVKIRQKDYTGKRKGLEDKIKLWVCENEFVLDSDNNNSVLITYKEHTKKIIDTLKIKNKPDIYKEFSKESHVRSFLLKKAS